MVFVIEMTPLPVPLALVAVRARVPGRVTPGASCRAAPGLFATTVPPAPVPSAPLLVTLTMPWLMLNSWAFVFVTDSTSVPASPLAQAAVVLVSRLPVRVRVLPGATRISLPAFRVRKLRAVEKVSVARKLPPWRLMMLPELPRAASLLAARTPALMATVPVKSLVALDSSIVPAPFFTRP